MKGSTQYRLHFGIDSSNKKFLVDDFCYSQPQNQSTFYAYGNNTIYNNGLNLLHPFLGNRQAVGNFIVVETVEMEVNTKVKTIKWLVDDIDQGLVVESISETSKYHVAITTYDRRTTTVCLIDKKPMKRLISYNAYM